MNALTVSLPDELDDFVNRRIPEEAYADAGEYVRALIPADRRRAIERGSSGSSRKPSSPGHPSR